MKFQITLALKIIPHYARVSRAMDLSYSKYLINILNLVFVEFVIYIIYN